MNITDFNKPVRFDGDIIITDPCYLMKKPDKSKLHYPSWWDYFSKTTTTVENGKTIYNHPDPKDYPDARLKTKEDCHSNYELLMLEADRNCGVETYYSAQYEAESKAYHEAELKYYDDLPRYDDWDKCSYGERLWVLGFTTSICTSTLYGDWGCTTFEADNIENINATTKELGHFCADAGKVCVVLLDEVLKYNPDFNYHIEKPWTTTLIKNFHGEVSVDTYKASYYDDDGELVQDNEDSVMVVGTGNINFIGAQTSL